MSRYICSHCGSSRGEARYDNGTYCFSCNKLTNNSKSLIKFDIERTILTVPDDLIDDFPDEVKLWLNKYYINQDVRNKYNIKWSPGYRRVVFLSSELTSAWMRSIIPN